jgi:Cdc6-like AAA superfamily ATPase
MQSLAALVASKFAALAARVVIVVDEVDQLVSRASSKAAACATALETLFSMPRLPGAPAVAIITIANAVDLLERTVLPAVTANCKTLLFEPYGKDQLKSIVISRVKEAEGGEAALKALGPIKVELRLRKVAKECGDCRQVLSLIEEVLFEAQTARDATAASSSTTAIPHAQGSPSNPAETQARTSNQSNRHDPLQAIPQLPLEQQILLAALATSKREAVRVSDICIRYKELCRALRQPDNLGSKGQVSSALQALEQRGLLELRRPRAVGRGRGKAGAGFSEITVELSVSCSELRKIVVNALPLLERYMD